MDMNINAAFYLVILQKLCRNEINSDKITYTKYIRIILLFQGQRDKLNK